MIFFLSLVALTVAVFALAALRFTTQGHGRHSAETLRMWPLSVRGRHADAPVADAEVVVRFGSQPEAVA